MGTSDKPAAPAPETPVIGWSETGPVAGDELARELLRAGPPDQMQADARRRAEKDLSDLIAAALSKASIPPAATAAQPSLPVKIGRGGYKLTRAGAALVGVLVVVAEVLATDHAVLRAVFKAFYEWSAR